MNKYLKSITVQGGSVQGVLFDILQTGDLPPLDPTNLNSVVNVPYVLQLAGPPFQTHIQHGFWNVSGADLGDGFLWEAWVCPLATNANGYLVSVNNGGSHSLLWGFSGVPGKVTGNIWNGSGGISYGGTYQFAAGEWVHLAIAWSKTKGNIYTYVNGVCDGVTPFAGPRIAPNASNILYVGGSNHNNLPMKIAAMRCYDRSDVSYSSGNSVDALGLAFHPPRRFGFDSYANSQTLIQPSGAWDYTQAFGGYVHDDSPAGCISGQNSLQSPGTITITPASGGSLSNGTTYFYKVTAIGVGGETTPSAEASQVATSPNLTNGLAWPYLEGAVGYNVYRSTSSGTETFLATVSSPAYTDTGAVTPLTNEPPAYNETNFFPTKHPGFLEDVSQDPGGLNQSGPWNLGLWYPSNCSMVADPTCPYRQAVGSPLPAENIPSPGPVPVGALANDTFGRRNQTWAFQLNPTLGMTEGGSLGPMAWTGGAADFGILGGAAVQLGRGGPTCAFVNIGTATQDVFCSNDGNSIPPGTGGCGIAFRVQDLSNFWYLLGNSGVGLNWGYVLAGVMTHVGTSGTLGAFTTIRAHCVGTTLTFYTDSTLQQTLTNQTVLQNATGAGLATQENTGNSLNRYKNWYAKAG